MPQAAPMIARRAPAAKVSWRSTRLAWGPATRCLPLPTLAGLLALTSLPTIANSVGGGRDFAGSLVAGAVLGAAAAGFAVDDPAGETLAASPTSLARRRALRLASLVVLTMATWAALIAIAAVRGSVPASALSERAAEAAAVAGVALAAAGWAHRREAASAAFTGALGGGMSVLLLTALAQRFDGLPALMTTHHHDRWWLVAAGAWTLAFRTWRDPAR